MAVGFGLALLSIFTAISHAWLQSELQHLVDVGLGVSSMQAEYDRAVSTQFQTDVDGMQAVARLAQRLSKGFQKRKQALANLLVAAQQAYKSVNGRQSLDRCCNIKDSTLHFDPHFNATVTRTKACDRSPSDFNSTESISPFLQSIFKSNLNNIPELKWQYYGSEEGYSTFFPSRKLSTCYEFDSRYQPWYAAAASPQAKDIVIVLDVSGSMAHTVPGHLGNRLDIAKAAVISVLDTLYPTDEVGFVAFSTKAFSPPGCFSQSLAQATPTNIRSLKSYVRSLYPSGSTYYSQALDRAYAMMNRTIDSRANASLSSKTSSRDQVILFISDGSPVDRDRILSSLHHGNAAVNNRVVIMSYAIGNASHPRYLRLLADGTQKRGLFQHIPDFRNFREKLTRYYTFFKGTTSPTVYSMPYIDGMGLGLVITLATAVKFNNELKGVVAVDVSVNDVFSEVTYYASRENQYAFIIDGFGHALIHPMLPVPLNVHSDPVFHNIRVFETDPEFNDVYNSMMRRKAGNLTYNATRFIHRGDSMHEGTAKIRVISTYFWSPVSGTNYVVCIVMPSEEEDQAPSLSYQKFIGRTVYHRFDLVKPTDHRLCSQFGHLAIKNASSVKFAPVAFRNPSKYLDIPETATTVNDYIKYLDDPSGVWDNVYFKPTVRNSVRLTSRVDAFWQRLDAAIDQAFLVWRYIATIDGVVRLLPGSQLALEWDPFQQGWFTRALHNVGKNVLSTPYVDGFGAGYIITMAHTIQMDSRNVSSPVGAVMGIDFTMGYMWNRIQHLYPNCTGKAPDDRCFLMDQHGYLVIHEDFVDHPGENPVWVHLTSKEPGLAKVLIDNGIMVRRQCANYDLRRTFHSYEINLGPTEKVIRRCFTIQAVENSNVYLGIIQVGWNCSNINSVPCSACSEKNQQVDCGSAPSGTCVCPCWTDLPYLQCNNSFQSESRTICPPGVVPTPVPPRSPSATHLENCFVGLCFEISNATFCDASVGCSWCAFSDDRTKLERAYCATDLTCFGGVQGKCNPKRDCSVATTEYFTISNTTSITSHAASSATATSITSHAASSAAATSITSHAAFSVTATQESSSNIVVPVAVAIGVVILTVVIVLIG